MNIRGTQFSIERLDMDGIKNSPSSNTAIQSLWIGSRLSIMEVLSIRSFIANGHTFHLYVYNDIENIPDKCLQKDANSILPQDRIFRYETAKTDMFKGSYSAFSNLFRYKLILEKGGAWTDLDMICLKPVGLDKEYIFASQGCIANSDKRVLDKICTTSFIKAPPQSMVMKLCFERSEKETDRATWGKTGPQLLGNVVKELRLESFIVSPQMFCPIDFWDWNDLIKRKRRIVFSQETCGLHLWHEFWRRRSDIVKYRMHIKKDLKDLIFSKRTIYGYLQSKYLKIYRRSISDILTGYIYRLYFLVSKIISFLMRH
jgi:hypothetical protein